MRFGGFPGGGWILGGFRGKELGFLGSAASGVSFKHSQTPPKATSS